MSKQVCINRDAGFVARFITIIILIIVWTLGMTGCKKYLDKKPDEAFLVPVGIDDLQGLLDDANVMNLNLTPVFGEASADDYFLLQNDYNSRPTREQQLYIWHPDDYTFQNDWSKGYGPIYNANYCLQMIDKIPSNGTNLSAKNNIKGSALFYRAYNYLTLAWNYALAFENSTAESKLGIVLKTGVDFNEASIRATLLETYLKIIEDGRASISLLPDFPLHSFRPSKAAAYGLLARAYLSMGSYDSAYKYANLCLNLKSDLIDFKNNLSDPDILNNITNGSSTNFIFRQFNRETIFYTEINTTISNIATSRAKMDTGLVLSYSSTDLRKSGFFRIDGLYHRFRGSYSGSTSSFFSGIATDEMYLISAECLARGVNGIPGDKDGAMAVLNTLLFKRHTTGFIGLTATDAANALNIILLERRKELVMRGLRWIDIKRLNREGKNIVLARFVSGQNYTLLPNVNYYALPLPTDIIQLTGIHQNPYP